MKSTPSNPADEQGDTQESARTNDDNALPSAKLHKNGGSDNFIPFFYSNALHTAEGIGQKKATACDDSEGWRPESS